MKKITLLFLCALSSMYSLAQVGTVQLYGKEPELVGKGHRNEIPTVTYDDNTINISSEKELSNAQIIITGKLGEVLYYGMTNLNQTQTTIVLPQSEINEKDAIELYCDDKEYYGYFEE